MCGDFSFIRLRDNISIDLKKDKVMKCVISEYIYIYNLHIRDYAVCSYWVIQCYPGAVFHSRCNLI